MSSAAALPWILTAVGGAFGLGAVLLLSAWNDQVARAVARADLRALDAADGLLRALQPILTEGEPLLQVASMRPASPELIAMIGDFRRGAEAALGDAKRQSRPDETLRRLGLDPGELLRAAELAIIAATRLQAGAAADEPRELMHSEARHASARLSEFGAKMAAARARIVMQRETLLPLLRCGALPFAPIFGWRPQASK
jgi:hypothetical protein